MPLPDDPKLTWFIEQFLLGNLPPAAHAQLEQRMSNDAAFEQRVMAQWLVMTYLDDQQRVTAFYQEFDPIIVAAGQRKPYDGRKGIHYLIQVVGIAAVLLLCLGVGFLVYQYNQPLNQQVSTIPVATDDANDYGFSDGNDSIVVVRYDRLPGLWSFGNKYTWKADTLTVYGPLPGQSLTKNWRILPTDQPTIYWLSTGKQTYLIKREQTTLTPLKPNENR